MHELGDSRAILDAKHFHDENAAYAYREARILAARPQHCGEQHLHRYLSEFDFRYSNRVALGVDDVMRADLALQGVVGLTYRTTPR